MARTQLFKVDPSLNYIVDYFKSHLKYDENTNEYISDTSTYKKIQLFKHLQPFREYLKNTYYDSKINYPLNMTNLRGFNVVIRQLCKYFKFEYRYKIMYFHSQYEIIYYIKLP